MNKFIAIFSTALVLTSQNVALPAYAATPNPTPAVTPATIEISTLTLNQIINQNLSTSTLTSPTVQIPAPVAAPVVSTPETPQELAEQLVDAHYGADQYPAFAKIVERESTWNPNAVNRETGACGLGQANPCSKLADHSVEGQLNWMISYIDQRYGTPERAWEAELTKGWY